VENVSVVVTSLSDSNSKNHLLGRLSNTKIRTAESFKQFKNNKIIIGSAYPTSSPMWNVQYPVRICKLTETECVLRVIC
jgi:hypothetical protein